MIKRITRCCHFLFAVIILLLIIFPPYYAVDTKSNGKIYEAMGYYPVCDAPTSKDAYYCLVNSKKIDAVVFENNNNREGINQYTANFNTVKFIINIILTGIVYFVLLFALRTTNKRHITH
jgi:hypothetical protein